MLSRKRLGLVAGLTVLISAAVLAGRWSAGPVLAQGGDAMLPPDDFQLARTGNPAPTVTLPDFRTVARRVVPSVVTVRSERKVSSQSRTLPFGGDFFERFFGRPAPDDDDDEGGFTQRGLGSGVVVERGYILTNNHVVDGVDTVEVVDHEGDVHTAEIVGTDPKSDLAVLKVENDDLQPIALGNSDRLEVGEWVLAVGNPFSERLGHTVTAGIVSATGRSSLNLATYEDFIQTDAAINPGNSGGALVNVRGELVGINTAIVSRSGGYQGIGFAIPIDMARHIMNQLIDSGKVTRGYLGITIRTVDRDLAEAFGRDEPGGVLVNQVVDDTPAAEAGLKSGDIVVALNGEPVDDAPGLMKRVAEQPPGTKVDLDVVRDGRKKSFTVRLGELPDDDPQSARTPRRGRSEIERQLGIEVHPLTDDIARRLEYEGRKGVVVTGVKRGSPAAEAGLRRGDLIVEVDRKRVEDIKDYRDALGEAEEGKVVLFKIRRDDTVAYVPVRP